MNPRGLNPGERLQPKPLTLKKDKYFAAKMNSSPKCIFLEITFLSSDVLHAMCVCKSVAAAWIMNPVFFFFGKQIFCGSSRAAEQARLNTVSVSLTARFALQTRVKVVCFPSTLPTSCHRIKVRQNWKTFHENGKSEGFENWSVVQTLDPHSVTEWYCGHLNSVKGKGSKENGKAGKGKKSQKRKRT